MNSKTWKNPPCVKTTMCRSFSEETMAFPMSCGSPWPRGARLTWLTSLRKRMARAMQQAVEDGNLELALRSVLEVPTKGLMTTGG